MLSKVQYAVVAVACAATLVVADLSFAGQRGGSRGGGGGHRGGGGARVGGGGGRAGGGGYAVPRGSVRPAFRGSRIAPYGRYYNRGYWGGNRFYGGYPYWYGYPGFYGGLGWPYNYGWLGFGSGYGFGAVGFGAVGYPGFWGGYAPYYGYPGYVGVAAGRPYGGVRIDVDEREAEVHVDGYYAGIVNDFDGTFQELKLEPGPHRIEIRAEGFEPVAFDVNVDSGRTITYRTRLRPSQP